MQETALIDNINIDRIDHFTLQNQLLPGVSRTFAFTIPQLPDQLATVVTNAYLLCRIADTIEDDCELSVDDKAYFEAEFLAVVNGDQKSAAFAKQLASALSSRTPLAERQLIEQIPVVIRCLESFNIRQQRSLRRCIRIMSQGMATYQRNTSLYGLAHLTEFNQYCYYVAGVVGELLTELFCDYIPQMDGHYDQLMSLAISFGQGLQMTNILKDLWEDRERGACWFPRDIFHQRGIELAQLEKQHHLVGFECTLSELIGIAVSHLNNALNYIFLIPYQEEGIRRFCLWALGLAILTLRKLKRYPKFRNSTEVKISRKSVKTAVLSTNVCAKNNYLLKCLFKLAVSGLPQSTQSITNSFTEWFDYE